MRHAEGSENLSKEVGATVIAFCVVMGVLLAAFSGVLVLWIVNAVRQGYTPSKKREKPPAASGSDEADGGKIVPHNGEDGALRATEKPGKVKKPQGP